MSVDKVLNRPMFRQVALRKGYLKPIKASNGNFVMNPTPTSFQTASNFRPPMNVPQPGFFRGTVMPAAGATGRFLKNQFGLRGLAGAGGTYMLSDDLLTKLGVGGPLKTAINLGAGALGMTPMGRAIGYGYTGLKGLGLLLDKIRRDNTNPNLQYGDTLKQITGGVIGGEPLLTGDKVINPFKPVDPTRPRGRGALKKAIEERKKLAEAAAGEGSEVGIDTSKLNVAKAEGEQNVKGTDSINVADIKSAAVQKATGAPDITMRGDPESNLDMQMKPEAPVKDIEVVKQDTLGTTEAKNETPFGQQIALARQIKAELMKGQDPGIARRTFLLNLAAGLMSGTTKRKGLAGAVDVFGQALGPAANNYATLKLKESELENNLMSEALELAVEQFKAQNDVASREGESGFVQVLDTNTGKLRNIAAKKLKDGTVQAAIPGMVTSDGAQAYTTIPYGGYIRFTAEEKGIELQSKVLKDLSGAYKGYAFNKINLQILNEARRSGQKLAGPVGKFNLLKSRLGGAYNDIFKDSNLPEAQTLKDLDSYFTKNFLTDSNIKSYAEAEGIYKGSSKVLDLDKAKQRLIEDKNKFIAERRKGLEKYISPVGEDQSQDLERLAINETITVYALANALKSKDRLTQKDIENAQKLVNIFPLFKGQDQVRKSLMAVGETLVKDISRLELDFINTAFGDSIILDQFRNNYGLNVGGDLEIVDFNLKDATSGEAAEEFGEIPK